MTLGLPKNMDITYKNVALRIKTIESSVKDQADIVISEASEETKYKTIINVTGEFKLTIAVYWWHFSDEVDIAIHFSESKNILFVGAGRVSGVINLKTGQLVDINFPDLFWAWECINDHVLELGELECRLYSSNGKLIGLAHVDPPYDYTVTPNKIQFSSMVIGQSSIVFSEG